ncbi:MAG: ABC transporter substrate binding protein [Mariprofundaceae bacterium]|nr:ABC transporter substrate binding protein [Mariprofundaceae bacterium]
MRKHLLFCLTVCFILLVPGSLRAAGIAVLAHADITPYRMAIAAFREQLNLPVHEYYLGANNEFQAKVKTRILQQEPELIFALGKSALNFSRKMNSSVPVVFSFVLYPKGKYMQQREAGIAMSIAAEQQFKMLLDVAPEMHNVGVVYNPNKSGDIIRQAKYAALKLGITLVAMPASNQQEAAHAIADLMPDIDAMWMIPDTTVLTSTTFKQMMRLSLVHAVALIGLAPKHVRAGSLFCLSFDNHALGLQAGHMAKRMLQGKKLPKLVSPDVVRLVINHQAANRLGLHLPTLLLEKAAHVYPEKNRRNK